MNIVYYIDEDGVDVRQFERKFSDDFEVKTVDFTGITFDRLMSQLEQDDFDYLIVDYHLNENSGCGFNGDRILLEFEERYPGFPYMLLTNHEVQAIEDATKLDVERIRSKSEYSTDDLSKLAFAKRINAKVDQYKTEHTQAEDRITELLEKKLIQQLTVSEEQEIITLDGFLDKSLDGKSPEIPPDLKSLTNEDRLVSLLEKTDTLIEKIESYEDIQD